MKASILLADAAQSVGGKLYILGGGWTVINPGPVKMAVAIKLEVPWSRSNEPIPWLVDIVDADGQPLNVPSPPDGQERPVRIGGEVEVGRPPGLRKGTPLDSVIALNFQGLPLPPDRRFTLRLHIDGDTDEHWQCGFSTRRVRGQ